MSAEDKPPLSRYFEDTTAPIVYADTVWSVGRMGGDNVALTFATKTLDHTTSPPQAVMKTVLRLIIPKGQLKEAVEWLVNYLARPEPVREAAVETSIPVRAMN